MADEIRRSLVIDTGNSVETLGKLRREMASIVTQLESVEEGSEAFNKLNSELKKTEAEVSKVESAFGDATDKIKTLSGSGVERFNSSIGLMREGIQNLDLGKFKIGIQGATQAFGGLGKAIVATGIGALVLAITAIIANFDKLAASGGLVGKVFTFIGDTIKGIIDSITELSDAIGLTDSKAAAVQEAADARNKKALEQRLGLIDKVKKSYEDQIAVAKAAGKDTTDLENKSAAAQRQVLKTNIEYLENIAKQSTFFADVIEPVLNSQRDKLKELDQEEKVRAAAKRKEASEDAVDKKKKREEEDKARLDALAKEASDLLDSQERAKIAGEKFIADMKAADEKSLNDLAAMADAEINLLMESNERKAASEKAYTDMIKEENQKRLESEKQLQDAKFQITQLGLGAISDLVTLFAGKSEKAQKRAFNIQKGISIATSTISGIEGVINALTAKSLLPEPAATILKVANAASIAASTAVNIAKIKATKFESPSATKPDTGNLGGGGGGGSESTRINPPTFSLGGQQIGGAGNILGTGANSQGQQPIKVFVSETDISNVQNKVQVTEGNSLFGGPQ